jgi:hypothetical protein
MFDCWVEIKVIAYKPLGAAKVSPGKVAKKAAKVKTNARSRIKGLR